DIRPSIKLQASDPQLTGYRHNENGVTRGESRKDASSNVTTVATRSSSLRRSRQPANTLLGVLGVLAHEKTFLALNRETGVDPKHLHSFRPHLFKFVRTGYGW